MLDRQVRNGQTDVDRFITAISELNRLQYGAVISPKLRDTDGGVNELLADPRSRKIDFDD